MIGVWNHGCGVLMKWWVCGCGCIGEEVEYEPLLAIPSPANVGEYAGWVYLGPLSQREYLMCVCVCARRGGYAWFLSLSLILNK